MSWDQRHLARSTYFAGMFIVACCWVIIDAIWGQIGWGTAVGAVAATLIYGGALLLADRKGWLPMVEPADILTRFATAQPVSRRTKREQLAAAGQPAAKKARAQDRSADKRRGKRR